ncbi:MAG: response regulator [Planctomycetota bacterium]|nr:response regulator [Planctomycetota bacterium]
MSERRPLVLLVDDDEEMRSTLVEVLALEGIDAVTARHGAEAFERLRAGLAPDAILLDLMMPVMSGWEFRAQQRQDPALSAIPVMVLSASASATRNAALLEVEAYQAKPLRVEAVVEWIRARAAG